MHLIKNISGQSIALYVTILNSPSKMLHMSPYEIMEVENPDVMVLQPYIDKNILALISQIKREDITTFSITVTTEDLGSNSFRYNAYPSIGDVSDYVLTWVFDDVTSAIGPSVTKIWTTPGNRLATCRAHSVTDGAIYTSVSVSTNIPDPQDEPEPEQAIGFYIVRTQISYNSGE